MAEFISENPSPENENTKEERLALWRRRLEIIDGQLGRGLGINFGGITRPKYNKYSRLQMLLEFAIDFLEHDTPLPDDWTLEKILEEFNNRNKLK